MAWGKTKSGSEGEPPEEAAPDRDTVLLALVAQTEQLNERLTKLEDRFDAAMSDTREVDTDLQDLQVNSARLAVELQRVTEELRTDIDLTTPVDAPDINLSEPERTSDSDPTLRLPRPRSKNGWLPLDD